MMPGIQMEDVHVALLDAFDEDEFERMLKFRLDRRLRDLGGRGSFSKQIFDVIDVANREGWDVSLIREAHRYNPGNRKLREVWERYGLSPSVQVTSGSATSPATKALVSSQGLERIVQPELPFFDIEAFHIRLDQWQVRVCRVDLDHRGMGTAFLIGPDVVLTNYHVVEDAIKDQSLEGRWSCRFDFKILANGVPENGRVVGLHPDQGVLAHSPYTQAEWQGTPDSHLPTETELDYALLRLAEPVGQQPDSVSGTPTRGWETLPDNPIGYIPGTGIVIVQHPKGLPMKLALDTQGLISVNTNITRVRYRTNTEGGSSGSPVFAMEDSFPLIALHHYGDPSYGHPLYNQGVASLYLIRQQIADKGFGHLLG